jgi:hypothetical protein
MSKSNILQIHPNCFIIISLEKNMDSFCPSDATKTTSARLQMSHYINVIMPMYIIKEQMALKAYVKAYVKALRPTSFASCPPLSYAEEGLGFLM